MPKKVTTTENGVAQRVNTTLSKNFVPAKYNGKRVPERWKGSPDEKMFMNFQATKGEFREFDLVCDAGAINQSDYLRFCMKALVEAQGNIKGAIGKIEKHLAEMKFKKGNSLTKV